MQLAGCDFSSSPTRRKPIVMALGSERQGRVVLERLEREGTKAPASGLAEELPLFAAATAPRPTPKENAVERKLAQVVADELSPRDALALIYELKNLMGSRKS